ncbi:TonB-dependent receptor plug domain-containing protein [Rubrivirga sp. IMCC43871]|uniref:TonB-dependent receptor plug domain-containing protein n=1 Tax=Rubrivirga sp. IMCC43871 TaxID=3391575 RepID=UPI003990112D
MRACALVLLLASAVAAQPKVGGRQPATPDSALAEVTVTAARQPVATADAPARVTILDREALAATASLAEALTARAPVHVRRYGPSGLASVSIRGASAAQALVLLDGQPLTDPALGQVDLSLLPTALLESVEVLSGPASGLYGTSAVGGVVHLRPATDGVRASTGLGAWGERTVSALAGGGRGRLSVVAAGDLARADDDYTVADLGRVGQPRIAREGWGSRRATAYGALRLADGRTVAGLSLWAADAERGLGGAMLDGALVGARQWDRRVRIAGRAATALAGARVQAAGHVQRASLRYASPFPPTDRPDAIDDTGRTTTAALNVSATRALGDASWTAELAGSLGRADHPSLADIAEDRVLGAGLAGRQPVGRLVLFPALRADLHAPAGGERRLALAPQLGTNVRLAPQWSLKASAARAFRMPTLNDRFWAPGGNPDLRPETALSADLGAVWAGPGAQAEATVFATTARDQIVWAPTAAGHWAPENVARTRTFGVEASARGARVVRLGAPLLLDGGALATLLSARDLDRRRPLRYVPRWTLKAWAGVARGPVHVALDAQAVGARPTTAGGTQPLAAHVVLGARASLDRAIGPATFTVGVDLDNLLDARYETVRSHVMPPRHARLRLAVRAR